MSERPRGSCLAGARIGRLAEIEDSLGDIDVPEGQGAVLHPPQSGVANALVGNPDIDRAVAGGVPRDAHSAAPEIEEATLGAHTGRDAVRTGLGAVGHAERLTEGDDAGSLAGAPTLGNQASQVAKAEGRRRRRQADAVGPRQLRQRRRSIGPEGAADDKKEQEEPDDGSRTHSRRSRIESGMRRHRVAPGDEGSGDDPAVPCDGQALRGTRRSADIGWRSRRGSVRARAFLGIRF